MDKSLIGHTALALASTLAAYTAWTMPTITEKDDAVVVFSGKAEHLSRVEWHDETGTVVLQKEGDGITVTTKKQPTVPAAPTPDVTYPGTEQARELLQKLAPLTAVRSFGSLPADKLKTMGLEAPKNKLVLHFGDMEKVLEVGGTAFGTGDYYSRGPDGNAYLLRSTTLSSLTHGAIALQDHDAVGVPRSKFDRVVISAGGKQREVVQRHPDDPGKTFFADPAEPDHKLDTLTTWLERVLRLRVIDLENASPGGEPALTVEFFKDKTSVAAVRIWSVSDKGAVATSTHFKGPVLLFKGSAEAVVKDAEAALNEGK